MLQKTALFFFTVLCSIAAKAVFTPVTVTGFNKDVVANGTGTAKSSTTSSVDDSRDTVGFAFLTFDYKALAANPAPANALPQNGLINSVNTPGLSFQLAGYSANNSLRLPAQNASGTLTFATPQTASDVYVLAVSGGGQSTASIVVTFDDNTTQTFPVTVNDWYDNTGFAIQGIGRVNLETSVVDPAGGATNPRLYEIRLPISTANYSRPIISVTITKTNATNTGFVQVMGVSVNTVGICGAPATQPSNLVLTPTIYGVAGSFTASVPAANKYLVLRTSGTDSPDTPPTDGIVYSAGQTLGNAVVVSVSAGTTFSDPGLTINATFSYLVLGYNDGLCYGIAPAYNIVLPLFGSATIPPCSATPGGTITVGPTGAFSTLTAALTALNNAAGASGNIVLELQSTYTSTNETFPILVPNISTSPCAIGNPTLTIRPAAGATGLLITGSNATAILDFNNSQRVTLDGRPGGVGTTTQLSVINTNTAGVAIRLYNDASNNTVTYCDVQGQNTSALSSALSGVIYVGAPHPTLLRGNDYNSFTFNNIHGTAGGTPTLGFVSYGSNTTKARYNDSCTLSNNKIYDFFSATAATAAVKIDQGNNAWTISNNSVYQTTSRTYTAGATHRGLWITPNSSGIDSTASNFIITNNFIGGTAISAGGTAYSMAGAVANVFMGMDLSLGSGVVTSVQNNVVTNIALTSTSTSPTGVFTGIGTANGVINIGSISPNIIGSAALPATINVSSGSGGTSFGIRAGGGLTINITNNVISGIAGSGSAGTVSTNFTGIGVGGGTTINITGNTIGSSSVANSISLAASSSTTAQMLNGISIIGGSVTSVTNNLIANLSNAYTSTGPGGIRGIAVTLSACTITGNTIRNLSTATTSPNGGATSALTGIAMTSANAAGCNIIGNSIYALASTAATAAAPLNFTGIFYQGSSASTSYILKNNIHSFDAPADTNITFTGIDFASATAIVANNFIRLGVSSDGTSYNVSTVNRGISSNSSSINNSFLFNSIYIGGTAPGNSLKNSYAFIRTSASGTYDIRSNIFVNERSNAAPGGKHYTIFFTTSTTGANPNFNIYNASGAGGVFANNGTTDVATYTGGWIPGDANSAYGNPGFLNAAGSAATVNLHINAAAPSIAESAGSASVFIQDDIDGAVRSATLPDAGADEFTGVNPNLCAGTPVSGTISSSALSVCPTVNFTLSVSGSTGTPGISYQWQSSTDSTAWTNIAQANASTLNITQNATTFYRIVVTCSNSAVSVNSAGLKVATTAPTYAVYNGTLYTESFESWVNSCNTSDLPSISWRNTPFTGNNSWRRFDQGTSAAWANTLGAYTPAFTTGQNSARFHSYNSPSGTTGTLDFYVNMSAAGTSTNIKFDYINTSGNDSVSVLISTNGGTTFTRLDSAGLRGSWTTKTINITSASATTVIRLLATSDNGLTDIGIDNFQIVNFEQCNGTPAAGTITASAISVCPATSFTVSSTGVSQLAGIGYQWQSSPDSLVWTNISGATALSYSTGTQTVNTFYRLVVVCSFSAITVNSAGILVSMSAPTNCYCTPPATSCTSNDVITSVALTTLTNTSACSPNGYASYLTGVPVPLLVRGSTYPMSVVVGPGGTEYVSVWIDYNKNGMFDASEFTALGSANGATVTGNIIIPAGASPGTTRMRVRVRYNTANTGADACTGYVFGETEDYTVNIVDVVTPITLLTFSGERKATGNDLKWTTSSELNNTGFELQKSADGINFGTLAFIASKAVNGNSNANLTYGFADLKALTGNNYYRLRQIDKDGKFAFSSVVLLKGEKVNLLTLSAVYPNPVTSTLNLLLASPRDLKFTIIISDVTGKIVRQQSAAALAGDNKYELNVQALAAGNYVIKAICAEGCETVISRFVKQ